jgi:ketosteroid isomerase-like protein
MRKTVIAFTPAVFVLLLSCSPQKMEIEAEKENIKTALDEYVASIEAEDMDLYAQVVAHDPQMVNFGAFGDPILGWDALKKTMAEQNAAMSETKIIVSDLAIRIPEIGKLAWATSLWKLRTLMNGNPIELHIRCTWILERRVDRWVIIHFHKSIAQAE